MKKLFSVLAAVVFAVAMSSIGAMASEIDIDADAMPFIFAVDVVGTVTGAVTLDSLWTPGGTTDVDLGGSAAWPGTTGGAGNRSVGYYSSVSLQSDSTLKFEVANGAIKADTTIYLVAWDTTALAQVTVGTMTDFGADANGNYTWIRMQISTVAAGATFSDKTGAALGASVVDVFTANAVCVLSADDGTVAINPLTFVANKGLAAGANVTLALTEARDNNANPLNAPLAGTENIIAINNGVSAKIQYVTPTATPDGPATSTIDVEATIPRTEFVSEGVVVDPPGAAGGRADTDVKESQAALSMTDASEFGLNLAAGDLIDVTVKRDDVAGVATAKYAANTMTAGTKQWTYSTNFGVALSNPVTALVQILLTVDGTTVLKTGTWTVDFVATLDQSGTEPRAIGAVTLLKDVDSHVWGINGWQAVYPYLNTENTYQSWFVLNNASGTEGKVFFDLLSSSNATVRADLAAYSNKQVVGGETLAPGESRVYLPTELLAAFGLTGTTALRNSIMITITAPQASVTGTAFMSDPGSGGKRSMPLLTNGANYKQW